MYHAKNMRQLTRCSRCQKPPPAEPLLDEDDKPIIGHENFLASSLKTEIVANFGSVEQLKSTVSAAAMGMMGSGWIWVVMDQQKHMGVVPTYGAGTLLVRSRLQRTPRSYVIGARSKSRADNYNPTLSRRSSSPGSTSVPPTDSSSSTAASHPLAKNIPPTRNSPDSTRSYSTQTGPKTIISRSRSTVAHAREMYESGSKIPSSSVSNPYGRKTTMISPNYALKNLFLVGAQLSPLFCVSVHEHTWILDYGVRGKQEYLARFWNALDWERVVENFEYFTKRP
jgi:superoxide dismutase, Fe-Mn family